MGDVGARGFVFDALVGLAAWWGSFKHRQSLSSAPLSLCPLWSDWRRCKQRQSERPQGNGGSRTRLSGSVDHLTASGAAQTDWLGVGCCTFFITSCLDVIYGFGWENFGGPWLYFASMVCWTMCGFCYITDSLGGTSLADVTCALSLPHCVSVSDFLFAWSSSAFNSAQSHHAADVAQPRAENQKTRALRRRSRRDGRTRPVS
eukprot:COSAG02_NODE_2393_length_8966_cov_3.095974_2_plen_203_part_00